MARRFLLSSVGVVVFGLLATPSFAQTASSISTDRLQRYYSDLLSAQSDASKSYNQQLVDNERVRLRELIKQEINGIVSPTTSTTGTPVTTTQEVTSSTVIERQREIVDELSGRLNESTVDLNLLTEEEKLYASGQTGTGATGPQLTQSYPELLARKAFLEDQVDLLTTSLSTQQTRLSKLVAEQRAQTIGILVTVLWYVAIVFLVFWGEHFIRTQVILRLRPRRFRYALSKVFTLLVYVALIVWLIQRIFVEHPGLTTVLAVIGAALVFMMQDVIKSFLGWLTYKDVLTLGDRIHAGGYTGDVLDINIFFTKVLVSHSPTLADSSQAGKIVRIPNYMLLSGATVNYHATSDYEHVELPVRLADSTQGEKARVILQEILEQEVAQFTEQAKLQMERRMRGFYYSQVSPSHRVYMELSAEGKLTCLLNFPVPIGLRRSLTTRIIELVLKRFKEEGIEIA